MGAHLEAAAVENLERVISSPPGAGCSLRCSGANNTAASRWTTNLGRRRGTCASALRSPPGAQVSLGGGTHGERVRLPRPSALWSGENELRPRGRARVHQYAIVSVLARRSGERVVPKVNQSLEHRPPLVSARCGRCDARAAKQVGGHFTPVAVSVSAVAALSPRPFFRGGLRDKAERPTAIQRDASSTREGLEKCREPASVQYALG